MINSINSGNSIINNYIAKAGIQAAEEGQDSKLESASSEFEDILNKAVNEKDEKKLKEACRNFESVFINMMFKQMRSTVQKTDLFGSGMAEETFEDMLYENYSKEMSKGKGIGLADMMYKQLSKDIK